MTDLGPGDGGKGGVINALVGREKPTCIIKRGGAQGSHGVMKSDGRKFNFSQWGCGTFEKVPTFLSAQMVIMPVGIDNEAKALKKVGIGDPYALLSCDPEAIVATPWHKISSQVEEMLLKDQPHGTVGTGVGRAYRLSEEVSECTIRAKDLKNRSMCREKLQRVIHYYREKYRAVTTEDVLPEDIGCLTNNLDLLYDDNFLPFVCDLFADVAKNLKIVELARILEQDGAAIVECSHGVLTDAETGLKPHVSAIPTRPVCTERMLRYAGHTGKIEHLAVHRAYEYRHGAGPMPTFDPELTAALPEEAHKEENRWQGKIRAGALDINLLRHALDAC